MAVEIYKGLQAGFCGDRGQENTKKEQKNL